MSILHTDREVLEALPEMNAASRNGAQEFQHILVAVHGIGEQSRNATARAVATRVAQAAAFRNGTGIPPVAPQPLGHFHGPVAEANICLADLDIDEGDLRRVGFSEVFWADIPAQVQESADTLEEIKGWARTVVARAENLCHRAKLKNAKLPTPDFELAGEVLDEIVDTVYVLENLTFLAQKAGLFQFELRRVLESYLGDVQIVAEFRQFRAQIIGRFHRAMELIRRDNPDAKIHIVAHSEGTVVAFLGLLYALWGHRVVPKGKDWKTGEEVEDARIERAAEPPEWLFNVHGFMTLGSPIDKHLALWPHLWKPFEPESPHATNENAPRMRDGQPWRIAWRNYYDYGDPVGFCLDTAQGWVKRRDLPFEFDGEEKGHDLGFGRYLLPGKAHNDYWEDSEVFEHFITDVVRQEPEKAVRPRQRHVVRLVGSVIPYLASAVVLMLGVFLLYRAVGAYTHPNLDLLQRYIRFQMLGTDPEPLVGGSMLFKSVMGVTALVAGVTLFARLPRLARGFWVWVRAIAALVLGGWCYTEWLEPDSRAEIGRFAVSLADKGGWIPARPVQQPKPAVESEADRKARKAANRTAILQREAGEARAGTAGVLALAGLTGAVGLWVTRRTARKRRLWTAEQRRERWLFQGMRPLIAAGAVAVLLVVASQMRAGFSALSPEELTHLEKVERGKAPATEEDRERWVRAQVGRVSDLLAADPPAWPVFLAGAAFLYLWWLSALLFDLAFVWQRYIRNSLAVKRLNAWRETSREHHPLETPLASAASA